MDSTTRRDLLQHVALALPLASLLAGSRSALAQAPNPVKVDAKGLVAKITNTLGASRSRCGIHGAAGRAAIRIRSLMCYHVLHEESSTRSRRP